MMEMREALARVIRLRPPTPADDEALNLIVHDYNRLRVRVREMEQRARSIIDAGSVDDPNEAARGWYLAARDILGEG